VSRRIFGPKRDEVTGSWRKLHNEELPNLYSSLNICLIKVLESRMTRLAGHVARMGRRGMHIRYWWESQEGWRQLRKFRRRREDNIEINLRERVWV
jgi:hypothetical protein